MSLKWRIALAYSALLIVAITAMSGMIVWRFSRFSTIRPEASVNATMGGNRAVRTAIRDPVLARGLAAGYAAVSLQQREPRHVELAEQLHAGRFRRRVSSGEDGEPRRPHDPANAKLTPARDALFRRSRSAAARFWSKTAFCARATPRRSCTSPSRSTRSSARSRARSEAIGIVLGATAAAVVVFSIVLASQATTPINELSLRDARDQFGSARPGRGQPRRAAPANGSRRRHDEIGRLATSFNDLLSRLAEAFARERQFISDASHELKTPLTSINANAQMLLRWGDRDPADPAREPRDDRARKRRSRRDGQRHADAGQSRSRRRDSEGTALAGADRHRGDAERAAACRGERH